MNFEEFLASKADLDERIESYNKVVKEVGANLMLSALKPIFDKWEKLESISFSAYTPYFNDGETCYFHSMHTDPGLNGGNEGFYSYDSDDEYVEEDWHADAEKEVISVMKKFSDDDILIMFGDHVEVTITRDGITKEHCDHD